MASVVHINQTALPVGGAGSNNNIHNTTTGPNIKRNVPLYRYGKSSLLGRKGWKDGTIILYDDSTAKIFKQIDGHKKQVSDPIPLEDVILDTAFGSKAVAKYGAPPIIGNEANFITPENFIAVPDTKDRKKIHWFAAKDEQHLREIMRALADAVTGKVRPPNLGKGPFGRYFNQDESEKWITYWTVQQRAAAETENGEQHHHRNQNLLHNREQQQAVAAAPPASSKPTNNKSTKSPPIFIRQVVEIPNKVESLRLQRDNLMDETPNPEYYTVRLIGGRRVKESVTKKPEFLHQGAAGSPVNIVPVQQTGDYRTDKNGHQHQHQYPQQNPSSYKSEISTYVTGEKPALTTTNITISPANNKEQFSQHREREEIVSENQKTVINVGTAERVVSNVDDSNDGAVIYTTKTTKQSSYHRSTVTNSNE